MTNQIKAKLKQSPATLKSEKLKKYISTKIVHHKQRKSGLHDEQFMTDFIQSAEEIKKKFSNSNKKSSRLSVSVSKTPLTIKDKLNSGGVGERIAAELRRTSPNAKTSLISYKKDTDNEIDNKKQLRTTSTTAATMTNMQRTNTYAKLPKHR